MTERPAWHTDEYPELRDGPPWQMEEMIAAEPGLAAPILGLARRGRRRGRPRGRGRRSSRWW